MRACSIAAACLAVPFLALVALVARWAMDGDLDCSPISWEREEWLEVSDYDWFTAPHRLRMAQSLIRDHALLGRTRSEVIAQLGEAPRIGGLTTDERDVYYLGMRGWDDWHLGVHYGTDGRVARVALIR